MTVIINNFKDLPTDIIFNIIGYLDECSVKNYKGKLFIDEPKYKLILHQLNYICSKTDHCSVKSWRLFNKNCMKILYKKCNTHDFHMLLNNLSILEYDLFVENETSNMLHNLALIYYNILNHIYVSNYPNILNDDKKLIYSIFWDYCKYYFMIQKSLCPIENSFLL
jgi:hypothetical protein